jgi:hypothetical protein
MRESSLPRVFRSLGHDEAERAASTTGGALLAVRLLFFVAYADLGTRTRKGDCSTSRRETTGASCASDIPDREGYGAEQT